MIDSLFFVLFFPAIVWCADIRTSYDLEKDINLSLENSARLQTEKEQIELKLTDLQNQIKVKKINLLRRTQGLLYLKKFQWSALLSRADSPAQLERNLKMLNTLSRYDLNLFKEFKSDLKALAMARINLDETLEMLKKNIQKLKQQQKDLVQNEKKELAENSLKNRSSFLKFKGQLPRPLVGSVIWSYGSKRDLQNQYVFVSKGLLFQSQRGQSVHSVGPGVIIFSDAIDPWRETLIVQHDDHYYSVYTGLRLGEKKVNATVDKNEVIGESVFEDFYFELRHFDAPINPQTWFKESL